MSFGIWWNCSAVLEPRRVLYKPKIDCGSARYTELLYGSRDLLLLLVWRPGRLMMEHAHEICRTLSDDSTLRSEWTNTERLYMQWETSPWSVVCIGRSALARITEIHEGCAFFLMSYVINLHSAWTLSQGIFLKYTTPQIWGAPRISVPVGGDYTAWQAPHSVPVENMSGLGDHRSRAWLELSWSLDWRSIIRILSRLFVQF